MDPRVDIDAAAARHIRETNGNTVRVRMTHGCSRGYSVGPCDGAADNDFVFHRDGVTVVIDRYVMLFLDGGSIRYEPGLSGGLKIDDNADKGGCSGCSSPKPGGCNG